MSSEIKQNLVYLTDKLTNLEKLILYLIQEGVFSKDERERILSGQTTLDRNTKFWDLLERKDWELNRNKFLKILRQTKNCHCADKLEWLISPTPSSQDLNSELENIILVLEDKWWPEEKILPKAFQERRLENNTTLVEELYKKLVENQSCSTVICQGATVSGLGGVGKTTTAKWFAQHYQHLYDHIIWIDCGEGSLISSFKDLANELNINPNLRLNLLAKKCFSEFQGFKCLCIFDNAESYQGPQGIRQVLPKIENIHSIITSRTREWGSESGDGQISELQLDTFNTNDSVIFLKNNLKDSELYTQNQMEEFCELLGNLPLALQIAVNTINSKKISLKDYSTRITTTPHILNQNFDDYERTINKTMKISLDLIKNHESDYKQLAYNILLIFGYIKPDFVEFEFFQEVEKASTHEVLEALELLEKYSLITRRSQKWADIHRLLQQVIRHNSKDIENSLLQKILSSASKDFVYYKLIPYSFASEELQKEFPHVRAELIDQMQLKKLMQERRFVEAVELSRIITNTLNSTVAEYNHAFCLATSGHFESALKILETLYENFKINCQFRMYVSDGDNSSGISSLSFRIDESGIVDLRAEIKIELVAGALFIVNARLDNTEKATGIMMNENLLLIPINADAFDTLLVFLGKSCSIANYELNNNNRLILVKLDDGVVGKKIKFNNCSFGDSIPGDLNDLILSNVDILAENGDVLQQHNISKSISPNLNLLSLECNYQSTKLMLELSDESLVSILHLSLKECAIILNKNRGRFSPIELELNDIIFIENEMKLKSVVINEIIDFNRTVKFDLHCRPEANIYFDYNCPMNVQTVFIYGITDLLYEDLIWNINELTLMSVDIPLLSNPTKTIVNHLHLRYSTISLSSLANLSQDVEKLTLFNVKVTDDSSSSLLAHDKMSIGAKEVKITDVEFVRSNIDADSSVFTVNDILCFGKIKELSLISEKEEGGNNMILDLNESFLMENIYLLKTTPLSWENSKCNIIKLSIRDVDISFTKKTNIRVEELNLCDAVVDWNFLVDISRKTKKIDLCRVKIVGCEKDSTGKILFMENLYGIKIYFTDTLFIAPNGDQINDGLVNDLINLENVHELKLVRGKNTKNLTLDMKEPFNTKLNSLYLRNVKLENFYSSPWQIDNAFLFGIPLARKSSLRIKSLTFGESSLDTLSLPENIQRLNLYESSTLICNHSLNLPALIYISLPCHFLDTVIKHLSSCLSLSCIQLSMTSNLRISKTGIYNLDCNSLPKTIRKIKLIQPVSTNFGKFNDITLSGEGVLEIEKLVLENFRFPQLEDILSKLKPETFVFKRYRGIHYRHVNHVVALINNPFKKFVLGRVFWYSGEPVLKPPLDSLVDKFNMCYLFENRKGISIEEVEFEKYSEL